MDSGKLDVFHDCADERIGAAAEPDRLVALKQKIEAETPGTKVELDTSTARLVGECDLIVTATSAHSRNHTLGFRVGRGESLEAVIRSTETVAEGVETTRSVLELAARLRVEVPITREVHDVLFRGKSPRQAVEDLMSRQARPEIE